MFFCDPYGSYESPESLTFQIPALLGLELAGFLDFT